MDLKRIFSALILFPLVAAILIFGNKYLVDICVSIIAIMSLHEYFSSFKEENGNKDLRWIAYLSALLISIIHIIYNCSNNTNFNISIICTSNCNKYEI